MCLQGEEGRTGIDGLKGDEGFIVSEVTSQLLLQILPFWVLYCRDHLDLLDYQPLVDLRDTRYG